MSATIDEQFVEYVVKSLVGHPDDVKIDRRVDEKGVLLELTVNPEDLGRVIGKRGATAQSLRTLLRALGTKQEARYNLKIVDVDRLDENGNPLPRPERENREEHRAPQDAPQRQSSTSDDDTDATQAAVDEPQQEEKAEAPKESDALARTRAELADLDDLDI
ncbi:MAG: KH domain-containing protein [Candidatus Saccharimonadales bacterium]